MSDKFRQWALDYHAYPVPGKIQVSISKPTETQLDLSLAYTPGVAEPVKAIAQDKSAAYQYTNKGNLVAVITNGTAVLGLGNVGALAGKPVMEGKAVLFKRFADIDVFDIEIDCHDPDDFIKTVTHIAPTFGGINLEDIKAPECFYIEEELKKRLPIPVFHDDQHGTAIVIAAGLLNALELQNKTLSQVKIVCLGAGAAGYASVQLLLKLGANKKNIFVVDREGVIHAGRQRLNKYKQTIAQETNQLTLAEVMHDADVFIGVAGPGVLTIDMVNTMASHSIIFALSNPLPEINPAEVAACRPDIIFATGRSDYPNQVNNALCFPYLFRGALDAGATTINEAMQLAAVYAIQSLAKEPVPASVLSAYNLQALSFGPNYFIPKLLDPRLRECVSKAVTEAAINSGASTKK